MLKRLLAPLLLLSSLLLGSGGCTPGQVAGLRTANTIMAWVACGIAAANETPCTPTEALASFMEAQREIVTSLAGQASKGTDPDVLEALLKSLEANAAAQRALTEQVVLLAEKATAAPAVVPAPAIPAPLPPAAPVVDPPPAVKPPEAPVPPAPVPVAIVPAPTS